MDFSIAKNLQNLGGHVFSSIPYANSFPSFDLINPGINLQMYQEIAPLSNGSHIIHKIDQNIEDQSDKKQDTEESQEGKGPSLNEEEKIEHSFLHPRPIKTELIRFFENKPTKRKNPSTEKKSEVVPKKMMSHRFSVI